MERYFLASAVESLNLYPKQRASSILLDICFLSLRRIIAKKLDFALWREAMLFLVVARRMTYRTYFHGPLVSVR